MKRTTRRLTSIAAGTLLAAFALSACATGDTGSEGGGDGGGEGGATIALLLPESKTTRYESFDRPLFEAKVAELGDYEVLYSNADQDPAKQQQQAESALASGIDVMVLDPVDGAAAASIVAAAAAQDVPVVSYDRLVESDQLAYYISFDNEKVGQLQGEALVEKLEADGNGDGDILMVNGSPTDGNAVLFKEGAHSVIDESGLNVVAEFDTPDWSPDKAQEWVAGQLSQYGDQLVAVYAANDGTAGGAIAAMKAANIDPLPVVTGQDAELAAIQRIVAGDQFMTIYKAIKQEAELAAEIAVALANGEEVEGDTEVNGIPSTLLEPVVVTVENIMDTVVADGFYTVEDICTAEYADACAAAGIE